MPVHIYRIVSVDYPPTTFRTLDESLHTEGQHVPCIANASETYFDDIRLEFQLYNLPHNYWFFSVRSAEKLDVHQCISPQKPRLASNGHRDWTASLNIARYISVNNSVYTRWSLSPSSSQIVTVAVSVVKPRELCLCRYVAHPCYAEAVMAAPMLHSVPSLRPPPCLTGTTSSDFLSVASATNRGVENLTELNRVQAKENYSSA